MNDGSVAGRTARVMVRIGLVTSDAAALPVLGTAWAGVAALGLSALGAAAGAVALAVNLQPAAWFPVFPAAARIACALALAAFAAVLAAGTFPLARLVAAAWRRFWSWQRAAWTGTPAAAPRPASLGNWLRPLVASGVVLAAVLATGMGLMMILARAGGFWHAWRWFT